MRQWELFGITDDDPFWTPPPPRRPDPGVTMIVPDLDDEDLVPEPAA